MTGCSRPGRFRRFGGKRTLSAANAAVPARRVHMRRPFHGLAPYGRQWQPGLREDHGND
jgi:hypothetical protein